ncbi:hypothetical protein SDC9_143339 [bioreactor metagenome]|uniref:Uncharacterized protein n=1 Tax=bioreactor metagenome TaxID=1076179 RepID=A0A645E3P7_9ZZZZ
MAVFVEHHLGRIGILQRFKAVGFGKRFHQSGYLCGGIVEAFFDGFQLRRLNKRFVALNIDNHIKIASCTGGSLVTTVGTAVVMRRGHNHFPAKSLHGCFNTFVIGSHIHLVERARHLFIHTLNHGFSAQQCQRFRRETGGCISGRNNSQKFHLILFLSYSLVITCAMPRCT